MTSIARPTETPAWAYVAIFGSMAAVAAVDFLVPRGSTAWIFYLVPLVLCVRTNRANASLMVAGVATVLLLLGYFLAPTGLTLEIVRVNRSLGLIVIWGLAFIVRQLARQKNDLEHEAWLRQGEAAVALRVQGEPRVPVLARAVLDALSAHTGAHVGAFYTTRRDGSSVRVAALALDGDDAQALEFRRGEGLVGRAAADGSVIRARATDGARLQVRSGILAQAPSEVVVVPLTAGTTTYGVLELGFVSPVSREVAALLELLREPLGTTLRACGYRTQLEDLLEETQRQTEELQTQQEELRVTNEELEEQSRVLQESQVRLEAHHAELAASNDSLAQQTRLLEEQKVALDEARAELAQRAEELERTSRYKSEFLANMSHELRTPLNSALILAKLLADNKTRNLTDEQVRFASSIYNAGNDLLELINDVLDLSKIEAGMMDVTPTQVTLSRVTSMLEDTFRPLAKQKGIALTLTLDSGLPVSLETDAQRLQQILRNLLSNAIKFTSRGEVTLRVFPAANGHTAFAVRDTGIGIDPSQHGVIFEAFRQADGTTNRKYGGTGLGLSVSRDLAHLLGGSLGLESALGEGSTFTLVLPPRLPPRESPRHAPSVPPARRASTRTATDVVTPGASPVPEAEVSPPFDDDRTTLRRGEGRVLLVVEDDLGFARILYGLAHDVGFSCIVATTADEGVRLANAWSPAALVLDVGLPDHSGLTVLDRLKRTPSLRHVPIHVVSAADARQTALEMGAAGYTLKPVEREQLLSVLTQLEARLTRRIRSVLIVEDDDRQRESMCALLSAQDVRTVAVGSAREALDELERTPFDCVVLDLSLPDASGFELLEQMASRQATESPPVIVYTGRSLSSDEEQRLRRYSRSIILKGARSPERLLDEVTLFLHQVEATLPSEQQRMLAAARSRDAAFEGRRILVVEDDVRNIFALSRVLEPRGAIVEIARNGRDAVDRLSHLETPIDLVLMDIMMPEMDGYEAMRAVRAQPEHAQLPIIALTARAMRDDQQKCIDAGANDYIAKPIDVDQLLSLMRVWMPK